MQITPVYAEGPPQHASADCASPKSLTWEVTGTQFVRRASGSKDGPVRFQSLVVGITNDVTGHTSSCSTSLTGDPGLQRMSCFGQEANRPRERYHIQTEAFFDITTHFITINETWFCDSSDPAAP